MPVACQSRAVTEPQRDAGTASAVTEGSPGCRECQLGKDKVELRLRLAPLCKGSCRGATEGLSRAVLATDSLKIGAGSSSCRTIPPARLTPTHLPLHKGGKILRFTLLFLLRSAPVATLATPQSASLTAPLAGAPRAAQVSHHSSFLRIRKRRKGTTLSSSSVFTCSPQH